MGENKTAEQNKQYNPPPPSQTTTNKPKTTTKLGTEPVTVAVLCTDADRMQNGKIELVGNVTM